MPNGGSDCCLTCWFKQKSGGARDDGRPELVCEIRGLVIESPAYTYCANHPKRRPQRDVIPIGPVTAGHDREQLHLSPDSEEVRLHLLALLGTVEQAADASDLYPIGDHWDEIVIWQLGEFREVRALADLQRIAALDPDMEFPPFGRTRARAAAMARDAIEKMKGARAASD